MNMKRSRILVAEDQPGVRHGLVRVLESAGYEVSEACDGSEAVARLRESLPDLLLVDLRMPGLDGLGVLEAVRAEGWDLPVVVLSANDDSEVAKSAMRLGARDYLLKPFDIQRVQESVRWHLEGRGA